MKWEYRLHGAIAGGATAASIPRRTTTGASLATWLPQLLLHANLDYLLVVRRRFIAWRFVWRAVLVLAIQQLTDRLQVTLQLSLVACSHPHPVQDYHPAGEDSEYTQRADDKDSRGRLEIRILVYFGEVVVGLVGIPAAIVVKVGPVLFARTRLIAAIPTMIEAIAVESNRDAVVVPAQKLRANVAI